MMLRFRVSRITRWAPALALAVFAVITPNLLSGTSDSKAPAPVNAELLNEYLGKNIGEICRNGFTNNRHSHCAHFVGHVLGLDFGYTCSHHTKQEVDPGANLRVHEIFAKCPSVGVFDFDSPPTEPCIIFITAPTNVDVANKSMRNVPKKHVGIFADGTVWHYSNKRKKVITQTPEEFKHHYANQVNGLFIGSFPK